MTSESEWSDVSTEMIHQKELRFQRLSEPFIFFTSKAENLLKKNRKSAGHRSKLLDT